MNNFLFRMYNYSRKYFVAFYRNCIELANASICLNIYAFPYLIFSMFISLNSVVAKTFSTISNFYITLFTTTNNIIDINEQSLCTVINGIPKLQRITYVPYPFSVEVSVQNYGCGGRVFKYWSR